MIYNELFFGDKILSELKKHRGVRIGESSMVSTKLHFFNGGSGEVLVIKSKDLGKCAYGEDKAGSFIHIDTFHSTGRVDYSKIQNSLREIFPPDAEIIAGGRNFKSRTFNEDFTKGNHVHIAVKAVTAVYGLIIPAIWIIEEAIMSQGLKLKKIKSFKCRRYWFFSDLIVFRKSKDLFGDEYSDTPVRTAKGGCDTGALVGGGLTGGNECAVNTGSNDKLRRIIRYLRVNNCLIKEKTEGIKDENGKVAGSFHKDEWIENIDINGTAISLLKKKYWSAGNCEIEEKDIKVYNYPIKYYRDTIFIIDNSQSMRGDNIESVKRIVSEICNKLKGGAAIVTFSGNKAYLYSRFTNNKEKIRKLIDRIDIQEVTPLAHGLNVAYEYAARSLKKNINIVLLTDGEPNVPLRSDCPLTDCIEVSALIRRKGYNLCCICTTDETSAVDKIIETARGKTFNINGFKG